MDKYQRIKQVGEGSFGKAYLVKSFDDGKNYVMKTIDLSRMSSKQRNDASSEVKVLSKLKHPYIISFRESFVDRSHILCIIMDYADGGDLYQLINKHRKRRERFSESRIIRWITQCLLGLKHMHDKHILHRDIKSQNLFITNDRLRLGDFGISKVLENTGAFCKTTIGTPYYLSPEICAEQPYSWVSDIWALGCILYELCTLKVPFDAQNLRQLIQKITKGPTPNIPSNLGYSTELVDMCMAMLSRDWKKRPTASDLLGRDIVQNEIRIMLEEEQSRRSTPQKTEGKQNGTNQSNGDKKIEKRMITEVSNKPPTPIKPPTKREYPVNGYCLPSPRKPPVYSNYRQQPDPVLRHPRNDSRNNIYTPYTPRGAAYLRAYRVNRPMSARVGGSGSSYRAHTPRQYSSRGATPPPAWRY